MDSVHLRLVERRDAATALHDLVVEFTRIEQVQIDRHCVRCGSGGHGRPVIRGGGAWLSLARAGNYALVGICTNRPIGVDLELAGSVVAADLAAADIDDLLGREPTNSWVRAEAIGKAHGLGLQGIREEAEVTVVDLDLGPDIVAAVAIVGLAPVKVEVSLS